MSRTANSIRNLKVAVLCQILGFVASFISRMVFVRFLSVEYLGLNGLFSNILTMLSLAEMGIGSAITYSMYKPLAEGNWGQIRAHMKFIRKAYTLIAVVMAILGVGLTPFVRRIVGDLPSVPGIEGIYLLFVANSVAAYVWSSRRTLLIADQKRYIATLYRYAFFLLLNIVQIGILIATSNFVAFLVVQILFVLLENIAVSTRVRRLYPRLGEGGGESLYGETRAHIIRNVKALVFHKIGGVIVVGTDSIVISMFVSVAAVGLYSNYLLITTALSTVLSLAFGSMTASVGNLGVSASLGKQLETFRALDLAVKWAYAVASVGLAVLMDPFVSLWLGDDFVFDPMISVAIAINFYLAGVRHSLLVFKEAKGLFWPDRFRPLAEALVNLVASIALVQMFGVLGVIAGTILSIVFVCLPWEPVVLFKRGFGIGPSRYYWHLAGSVLLTAVAGSLVWWIVHFFATGSQSSLIIGGIACLLVPSVLFIACYGRSDEFKRIVRAVRDR